MLSFTIYKPMQTNEAYVDGDCLSTDAKPTQGIYNGSILRELDTGKVYRFDGENETWIEWTGSGGGGGSTLPDAEGVDF